MRRTGHPEQAAGESLAARILRMGILTAILILPDQITKIAAKGALEGKGPAVLIPGILELRYVENRGAAFGMLQNRQWLFVLLAAVISAACIRAVAGLPRGEGRALKAAALFLAAGALGNMIDRVARGFVIDFIYVSAIHFPVFNLADMYVVISTAVLLILLVFVYPEDELWRLAGKNTGNGPENAGEEENGKDEKGPDPRGGR